GSSPAKKIISVRGDNGEPTWSPDGSKLAFVASRGDHSFIGVYTDDTTSMTWIAPTTNRDDTPVWSPDGTRIAFARRPGSGGAPVLLTPGNYMAEYITLSPDKRFLLFAGNAGSHPDDIDRRHVVRVPVDRALPEVLTPGLGLEWTPVMTGDNQTIAYISATAQ